MRRRRRQDEGALMRRCWCPDCEGTGEDDGYRCRTCGGMGEVEVYEGSIEETDCQRAMDGEGPHAVNPPRARTGGNR